ncbi:MAG: division/cell wall cluster transcriptional repressor MraZ [Nevskia sp.]|nr:division/cell wall cluster transcriptional repressor MraZ [Nevskia sp.]
MSQFSGTNQLTMDDKGRLAIPARLRTQIGDEYGKAIVMTLGPECIEVYPVPVFRRKAEAIPKMQDREKRTLMLRLFVGYAVECEPDAQGRVLVPPALRERKLQANDVVLVGQLDHFELWTEAEWNSATVASQPSYADAYAALNL